MVLLESVVEVTTHSMSHLPAELDPDRSGIGVMTVCRDPCRRQFTSPMQLGEVDRISPIGLDPLARSAGNQ
jgi:hypothetical protein